MKQTYIELESMEFYAFHGHYAEEQRVGNRFRVDLSYSIDSRAAGASDDLSMTVSYLDVYECIREQMGIKSHLLEHLGQRIIAALRREFPSIGELRLKVSKMAPPLGGQVEKVSIIMED